MKSQKLGAREDAPVLAEAPCRAILDAHATAAVIGFRRIE